MKSCAFTIQTKDRMSSSTVTVHLNKEKKNNVRGKKSLRRKCISLLHNNYSKDN